MSDFISVLNEASLSQHRPKIVFLEDDAEDLADTANFWKGDNPDDAETIAKRSELLQLASATLKSEMISHLRKSVLPKLDTILASLESSPALEAGSETRFAALNNYVSQFQQITTNFDSITEVYPEDLATVSPSDSAVKARAKNLVPVKLADLASGGDTIQVVSGEMTDEIEDVLDISDGSVGESDMSLDACSSCDVTAPAPSVDSTEEPEFELSTIDVPHEPMVLDVDTDIEMDPLVNDDEEILVI